MPFHKEFLITRNRNTHAKRQREMDKKARAADKRTRKTERKLNGPVSDVSLDPRDLLPEDEEQSTEEPN